MFSLFVEYQECFYTFTVSIFLLISIHLLKNKFEIFNETPSKNYRKIHETKVTRIGGISILSFFISVNYIDYLPDLNIFFFCCAIIFAIGFIEDISNKFNYIIRFLFLIIIIFYLTFYHETFRIEAINYNNYSFLKNYIFLAAFSFLGILFCINGSNFIDGLNGLTLGTSIIIFLNYIYLSKDDSDIIYMISLITCISIVPLFLVNIFTGSILTGDSGSYLIGFIYGCIGILIYNSDIITPFHVACILFYPTTELIFTFFRRAYSKGNPFKPDHFHLHTMLFLIFNNYLKVNRIVLKKNTINSLTASIILSLILFANVSFSFLFDINNYLVIYVILNIVYLFLYFGLKSYLKKIDVLN